MLLQTVSQFIVSQFFVHSYRIIFRITKLVLYSLQCAQLSKCALPKNKSACLKKSEYNGNGSIVEKQISTSSKNDTIKSLSQEAKKKKKCEPFKMLKQFFYLNFLKLNRSDTKRLFFCCVCWWQNQCIKKLKIFWSKWKGFQFVYCRVIKDVYVCTAEKNNIQRMYST